MEQVTKQIIRSNTGSWVAVPFEPTPEMYDRVLSEGYYHDEEGAKAVLRSEYQDMISAAPKVETEVCKLNDKLERIKHFASLNADQDVFEAIISIINE